MSVNAQPLVRLVSAACSTTRRPEESMKRRSSRSSRVGVAGLRERVEPLRDRVGRGEIELAVQA